MRELKENVVLQVPITTGQIVGRTFEGAEKYDVKTPDGIVCSIPAAWIQDVVFEVLHGGKSK